MQLSREERVAGMKARLYRLDRMISTSQSLREVVGAATVWIARLLTSDYKESFASLTKEEAWDAALRIEMNAKSVRMEGCLMERELGDAMPDVDTIANILSRVSVAVKTLHIDDADQLERDRTTLLGIHEEHANRMSQLIQEKKDIEASLNSLAVGSQRKNWADVTARRADYQEKLREKYFTQLQECCTDGQTYREILSVAHTVRFRPRKGDDGAVDIFYGSVTSEHGHAIMFPPTGRFAVIRESGIRTDVKFGPQVA